MKPYLNPTADSDLQARNEHLTALLARCELGSESAFEELYGLCSRQLFGLLLRILRIEAIAEEALQDSFVKIWQKAGTYVPENGSPMAWMTSIARHMALDLLRRRGIREDRESADEFGMVEAAPDLNRSLQEISEDAAPLMQCLEKLPSNVSTCLVRAYCEGYSHEELAQSSGTPIGTIKSWIRRGLISLRRCLDELS